MCVQGAIIGGLRHGCEPVPLRARGVLRQISVASSLKILRGVIGGPCVAVLFSDSAFREAVFRILSGKMVTLVSRDI